MPQCILPPNMVPSCGFYPIGKFTLRILKDVADYATLLELYDHLTSSMCSRDIKTLRIGIVLAFCGGVLFPITSKNQCNHVFLGLASVVASMCQTPRFWWECLMSYSWMIKKSVRLQDAAGWFFDFLMRGLWMPKLRRPDDFDSFDLHSNSSIKICKSVRVKCCSANKLHQGFQSSPQRLKIWLFPWPGLAKRSPCWEKKASDQKNWIMAIGKWESKTLILGNIVWALVLSTPLWFHVWKCVVDWWHWRFPCPGRAVLTLPVVWGPPILEERVKACISSCCAGCVTCFVGKKTFGPSKLEVNFPMLFLIEVAVTE